MFSKQMKLRLAKKISRLQLFLIWLKFDNEFIILRMKKLIKLSQKPVDESAQWVLHHNTCIFSLPLKFERLYSVIDLSPALL